MDKLHCVFHLGNSQGTINLILHTESASTHTKQDIGIPEATLGESAKLLHF